MSTSFRKKSRRSRQLHRRKRNYEDADSEWLQWAEARFQEIAGQDLDIDRKSFKKALQVRNEFFADRFFDMFDDDKSGTISKSEMLDGLFLLNEGTKEDKIRFFFDVYDLDNNGEIDKDELRSLVKTGMDESSVQLSQNKLDHLTNTLFTSADQDNNDSISFDEFLTALGRYPDLIENFSLGASAWFKSKHTEKLHEGRVGIRTKLASDIRNNAKRIAIIHVIAIVNIGLFVASAYRYSLTPDSNWSFLIARGCGNALNFNCSVVVVFMLRKTLSFLRSTWLYHFLPFDDTIVIHKIVGYTCFILGITHTFGHVGNALILETYKNFTAVELLFTNPSLMPVGLRVGRLEGSAFITGWILVSVLLILIVGSLSCVRRSGHFEIFFWTHKFCYMAFLFLLILHAPRFWYWFLGPALFLTLEKFSEMKIVKRFRYGKTYVKEVNLLPSGVTHLVLTRPRQFKFKAGDYLFIQIPKMAAHEWHPFTISSAPEDIDTVSLHIRSAGNWTKLLYQSFDAMLTSQSNKSTVEGGNTNGGFELQLMDEGDKNENTFTVEEVAIDMSSSDSKDSSEDEEEDEEKPRPVLRISRKGYRFSKKMPLDASVKVSSDVEAIGEETKGVILKDTGEDTHKETAEESKGNGINGHGTASQSTMDDTTQQPAAISVDETRRKSSNITFDLKTKGRIRVHIQGPYGTPSTSIFHSEHAVMIGAGIGVTPYASILQSIMYRHRNILHECPNCNHSWVDLESQKRALRVKKVDFIWLNRNYMAFEWFVDLLLHLEDQQSEYSLDRFLDIHLFMTGMKRFDLKNIGLQMALDLVHEKEERDILTGLRTKLQAGRPDWKKLFTKIKSEKKGKVSVYFCGAAALGSVIKQHCDTFGFKFHKESF
ncbi:NADPH oxidase 5-like isoform X1 [Asterias amurensis]|uniref:NADPH oxidase 5-like isoform X1 n=2 Tax=Asterias amurensis TaxID=7602 RepID=UPI003AB89D88